MTDSSTAAPQARDLGPARDYYGYGPNPPYPRWPGDARIAINFNLNFEAGGERSLLEGDNQSEDMLTDICFPAYFGVRSPIVETAFEYGPRVGIWRLLRIFRKYGIRISILGVVRALEKCPEAVAAFLADGHEIVSHGYRWIEFLHRRRSAGLRSRLLDPHQRRFLTSRDHSNNAGRGPAPVPSRHSRGRENLQLPGPRSTMQYPVPA